MTDGPVRQAFEACPIPMLIVDPEARLVLVNRAARVMLGRELDATSLLTRELGEALRCVHHDAVAGCGGRDGCRECMLHRSIIRALEAGPVHRATASLRLRGPEGETDSCSLVSAVRVDDDGRPLVAVTLEEVSGAGLRAVLFRDQLAADKERLNVTLRSIGDGVIATDRDGRVTLLNSVAEELTGWNAAEGVGASIHDVFNIVQEDTRQPAVNPVDQALREGHVVGLANHTALIARNGRERPIADSAAPIRDAAGRTLGAVLVFRDQTKERAAEQALRDSERRVRLKLESILSPEGDLANLQLEDIIDVAAVQSLMREFHAVARMPLAVLDISGKVLVGVGWQEICTRFHRVHPQTCRHCTESDTELSAGVRSGEVKVYRCKNNMWDAATPIVVGGQHLGNIFTGQFFFDDESPDRDLFRAQGARYGFEANAYLAALDAVPRLSRESVTAAMAFLSELAAMLSNLSFSNIKLARSAAEREDLLKTLRESAASLEASDRRKSEFLAMLSHELRNPLAPIRNSVYILQHAEPGGEQARRARAVIERQTTHLTRLVDDLLDVTRIQHGKIELRRSRTDLREAVLRAADDFRVLMEERHLAFHVAVPATCVWADFDPTRVNQVLGNLLHNAAKFTPRGGEVTLTLGVAGARAEIAVRDTGAGIERELLPTVFDAFVQADRTLARSSGGLGLGLALVKGITELHGGEVTADSEGPGKGARFTVALPLTPAARVELPGPGIRPAAAPHHRVLIVDDNHDAAESLAEIVQMLGHAPEVVHDGPSAIEKAAAMHPDVVLCDLGLPGMSGYDVARALRAHGNAGMQLVAVSGYAQPEDVEKALDAGFDEHIAKPCDAVLIERLLAG